MLEKRLHELIDFAKDTDLQEVVIEKDGVKVAFRRTHAAAAKGAKPAPASVAAPTVEEAAPEPLYIKSTMVGTFYRSDSANRPPLVVEGTLVDSGQPVASIEAMKIMKDVVAPVPCKILKALVTNGHAVEYGQPLFEIEAAENV